jgi:succinate-semialdehyde dehydrogenase/glutarate-semialdehyde dehydrogenase
MHKVNEPSDAARLDLPQIAAIPKQLRIGGQWRAAVAGAEFPVVDPADASVIARVADADAADARLCVDAAALAAPAWQRMAPRARSDLLMNCFTLMLERADWLAQVISLENGKSYADARGEVTYAAEFFRWYAEESVRVLGQFGHAPGGANHIVVQHHPIGISVLITPWNFPAAMATRKIAPALAAGCTCVLKPAAETPLTALALAALMEEAGIPAGVVNVVTTTRAADVVNAMLGDTRVRKLSFTGSTAVGRELLRQAATQVISCSMELGGNAPFLVFDDADLEHAVSGAMLAKMRNGGEACTAANRFLVQRGIYNDFTRRLAEEMARVRTGRGTSEGVGCGPLITQAAVHKVTRLVDQAKARGARVLTGGASTAAEGFFFEPTVIVDVPRDAAIFSEEIFGPVAAIASFDTEEEAIELANTTEYGLVAYVFTRDLAKGMRVAGRIEAGMVGVNRGVVSDPAAPFGGVKQSGLGREGGQHGLLEYLEPQYVAVSL